MILYDTLLSGNAYKVRLLMRHLGLDFQRKTLVLAEGHTKTPDYLKMNPRAQVPVLQLDDGRTIAQSNAIMVYLAEGTRYLPSDKFKRAKVLEWMFFEQADLLKPLAIPRFIVAIAKKGEEQKATVDSMIAQGKPMLKLMDEHLARHKFLVDDYSIADMSLYAYTHMAGLGGYAMTDYPNIQAWVRRIEAEPGYVPLVEQQKAAE